MGSRSRPAGSRPGSRARRAAEAALTIRLLAGALLVVSLVACASAPTQGARAAGFNVGGGDRGGSGAGSPSSMNQAELQQALERITTQFQSRIGQISMGVHE